MTKLKTCPCCGGIIYHVESMQVRKGWEADICCGDCLLSLHTITYDTEEGAISAATTAWNRRLTAEIEGERDIYLAYIKKIHEDFYEVEVQLDKLWRG